MGRAHVTSWRCGTSQGKGWGHAAASFGCGATGIVRISRYTCVPRSHRGTRHQTPGTDGAAEPARAGAARYGLGTGACIPTSKEDLGCAQPHAAISVQSAARGHERERRRSPSGGSKGPLRSRVYLAARGCGMWDGSTRLCKQQRQIHGASGFVGFRRGGAAHRSDAYQQSRSSKLAAWQQGRLREFRSNTRCGMVVVCGVVCVCRGGSRMCGWCMRVLHGFDVWQRLFL